MIANVYHRYVVTTRIDIRRSKQNPAVSVRRRRPSRNSSMNGLDTNMEDVEEREDNYYENGDIGTPAPHLNGIGNGHIEENGVYKLE